MASTRPTRLLSDYQSRCTPTKIVSALASINADKRAVLDSLGLSQLGKLQIKNIIRNGVVLVLNNYDLSNHSVRLPGNRIWQLSASDYATVYGLPMGPEVVDLDDLTDDDAIEYANSVGLGGHVTENGQISWSALEAAIRHTDDPVLWGKLLFLLCIVFKSYNWCQYFVDCTTSGILHKDAANVSYLLADLLYLNVGYVHAYLNGDADVGAVNLYTWKELTDHISDIDEELEDIPIVRRRQGKRKRKSGGDGEAGTSKEELDVKGKKVKKLKVKVEDKLRKGKDVVKRVKGGIVDDSSTDFKKSVKKLKGWHTLDVNLGLISTKEIGESKKAEIHNLIEVCVGVLAAANQKLKDVDQHISTLQSSSSSSSTEESSPEASSTDSDDDESDGDGAKTKDAGGKDSDVQVIKSSSDSDFEEEMNPSDKRKRTKKVVTSKRDVSKGKGVANTRVVAQKKAFKKPSKDTRVSNVKKTLPAETVKQIATEHPPSPMVNAAAGGVQDSPIEKVTVRSTGCPGNLIEAADALVELNDPGQSSTILDDPKLVRPIPVTPLTTLYSNAFVPDTYSTDGRKNSMPETSSFSFSDFRAKIYQYATSKDLARTVDAYSDLLNRRSVHDGKASRWIFPQQFSELIFSQIEDSQTSPYDAAKEFKKFLHNEWSKKVDFSDVKLWFFPLCSQNHYVLFAIDHIQKRYVFFDTKDPKSFQRLYSHWCDKVSFFFTSYIDVIAQEKKVAARSYVNYKFKEIKKIQQRKDDNSSSGIFMLNICQYWEGLYQPSVSSSWKIEKHINERRESILLDMILDPSNYLMQKVIEKAGANPIQAEANNKQG
ncbi:hypothetical protein LINPERPRIM_LOCUS20033 [Linum perenne]